MTTESVGSTARSESVGSTARLRRQTDAGVSAEVRQLARVMGALRPKPGASLSKLTSVGRRYDERLEAARIALRARSAGPAGRPRG